MNALWSVQETYFRLLRIWWMAALHLGLRENGPNGLAETVQPIDTGQEDVGHAPVLQVGQDAQPEVGSFAAVTQPMTQNVPVALHIHAQKRRRQPCWRRAPPAAA